MTCMCVLNSGVTHVDVINWKHFPRYWPFVRGIHRSPGNSPHKGQWRRALIFFYLGLNKRLSKQSWLCDLRRHRANYDVTVMCKIIFVMGNFPYSVTFIWMSHKKHILSQSTKVVTEYLINNIVDVRMPFADTSVCWCNFTNDLWITGQES